MTGQWAVRAAAAAVLVAAAAHALPAGAQDAPAVRLVLAPARIEVGGQPSDVTVSIENAPPLRGFEVVLAYDPDALAITGVAPGDLLAPSGSTIGYRAGAPGELRLFSAVATDDPALRPQGSGSIAHITFGALAAEGTWELTVGDLQLITADEGDGIGGADVANIEGAVVEIVAPPTDEERDERLAQAATFAEAAVASPGTGATLAQAFKGLRARLGDSASEAGPLLAWGGLLVAGALLALIGWWLGRETADAGTLSR